MLFWLLFALRIRPVVGLFNLPSLNWNLATAIMLAAIMVTTLVSLVLLNLVLLSLVLLNQLVCNLQGTLLISKVREEYPDRHGERSRLNVAFQL